jgi:hypothetical protein
VSTTVAVGGLAARFGDALTDQSYDAKFGCGEEIGAAASAHATGVNKQQMAKKVVAAIKHVTVLRITINGMGPLSNTRCRPLYHEMAGNRLRTELEKRGERYGQPGVIEKVTSWNIVAQAPTNSTVPVSPVALPTPLPLTKQPTPALPLNLNPVALTVPFIGPRAIAESGHWNSKVLPMMSFL